MAVQDREFERLLALASGVLPYQNDHDLALQIEEEEHLLDALLTRGGGAELALRKLKILALRLREEGHHGIPEGLRDLAVLDSAITDLTRSTK